MTRKKSRDEKDYEFLINGVREILKLRHGIDVIWHILGLCNIYGDNISEYYQGRRSVGLDILQLLEDVDPTAYAQMLIDKQRLEGGRETNGTNRNSEDRGDK